MTYYLNSDFYSILQIYKLWTYADEKSDSEPEVLACKVTDQQWRQL